MSVFRVYWTFTIDMTTSFTYRNGKRFQETFHENFHDTSTAESSNIAMPHELFDTEGSMEGKD